MRSIHKRIVDDFDFVQINESLPKVKIAKYEVSNKQFSYFIKADNNYKFASDSTGWMKVGLYINEPMERNYNCTLDFDTF